MEAFRKRFGLEVAAEATPAATSAASSGVLSRLQSTRILAPNPADDPRLLYPDLTAVEAVEDDDFEDVGGAVSRPRTGAAASTAEGEVRSRLRSMWHNVKYGRAAWTLQDQGNVHRHSPVWLAGGKCYQRSSAAATGARTDMPEFMELKSKDELIRQRALSAHTLRPRWPSDEAMLAAFHLDFSTRLWFTYRRDFEEFAGTSINTDCGWGCMIRSGQMLLGNALLLQKFGRSWRWRKNSSTVGGSPVSTSKQLAQDDHAHRAIVRLFGDSPDATACPVSIHAMMDIAGEVLGKQPGDWFGPGSTAHLLREAAHRSDHRLLDSICIYVARDCTVYRQDVRDLCRQHREKRRRRRRRTQSPEVGEEFSMLEAPPKQHYPNLEEEFEQLNKQDAAPSAAAGAVRCRSARESNNRRFVGHAPCSRSSAPPPTSGSHASSPPAPGGEFLFLSDGTEDISLDRSLYVEGEHWVVEQEARSAAVKREDERKQKNGVSEREIANGGGCGDKSRTPSSSQVEAEGDWTPVLALVPLRLGTDRLNPVYSAVLRESLASSECVGVIGGRPRHSLYFVGFQDENLIHLDPHLVQDHVDVYRRAFSLSSFHCRTPRKMHLAKMDPSCCIGFYFQTRAAFEGWCEDQVALNADPERYPMFAVCEGRAADVDALAEAIMAASMTSEDGGSISATTEEAAAVTEDFVFL